MALELKAERSEGSNTINLTGPWRITHLEEVSRVLSRLETAEITEAAPVRIDGSKVSAMDTAAAMELFHFLGSRSAEFSGFSPEHLTLLNLVEERVKKPEPFTPPKRPRFLERLGRVTVGVFSKGVEHLAFLGFSLKEIFGIRGQFRVKEFFVQLEHCFVNAVPVVVLVNFLICIVLAYLFAVHAEQYGANIFVVDSVAYAMCREFAPLIVAVIMAGRSGSAFAAQLGTMKLNEEVDALETLGLSSMQVLVVPRILALVVAMPLLVFIGDVIGILGGMLIADLRLGVTGVTFMERLQVVLTTNSVLVGLIKAPVFAAFIAIIGCRMGLTVENNARSVGLNTTSTVVQSIVSVILLNAFFAVIFSELGI